MGMMGFEARILTSGNSGMLLVIGPSLANEAPFLPPGKPRPQMA
jgi:hypothetical protein